MSEQKTKSASKAGGKAKNAPAGAGTEIQNLFELLSSMNVINGLLQAATTKLELGMSMGDWQLLKVLNSEGPLTISKAAYKIGMTRQRVHQQIAALEESKMISSAPADGKSTLLTIAVAGHNALKRIDQELTRVLAGPKGEIAVGPLHNACLGAKRLARAMTPKPDQKTERSAS